VTIIQQGRQESAIRADTGDFPARGGQVPAWASATPPESVAAWCMSRGAVATEVAAVCVPVLVAP